MPAGSEWEGGPQLWFCSSALKPVPGNRQFNLQQFEITWQLRQDIRVNTCALEQGKIKHGGNFQKATDFVQGLFKKINFISSLKWPSLFFLFSSFPLCSSEATEMQMYLFQRTGGKPLIQHTNAPNYGHEIAIRIVLSIVTPPPPFFFLIKKRLCVSTWKPNYQPEIVRER